jgi:hypothetical protein
VRGALLPALRRAVLGGYSLAAVAWGTGGHPVVEGCAARGEMCTETGKQNHLARCNGAACGGWLLGWPLENGLRPALLRHMHRRAGPYSTVPYPVAAVSSVHPIDCAEIDQILLPGDCCWLLMRSLLCAHTHDAGTRRWTVSSCGAASRARCNLCC